MSAQAQAFWLQWVEDAFPELDSRAYFLPPVYFNRVPMTKQTITDENVLVLHPAPGQAGQSTQPARPQLAAAQAAQPVTVQDSDVRDDAAMQRVFICLQKMAEKNEEVLVGMTQLQFGQYLREPCCADKDPQLPNSNNLPPSFPQTWKKGDFDVLLMHRHYGFVVCEVKSFGDNVDNLSLSQQVIDRNIIQKLKQAVSQLDKAAAMLSHLVSDIAPGLRVTKTIAVPNLTACQVQQVISGDLQLTQDLCRCLGTTDPTDITGLCLCSNQLSDRKTPWVVSSDVLRELGNWWQRRVVGAGPDSHMTSGLYRTLVARFCGPATTVSVPSTSPPRLCLKTIDQAVSLTGECYTTHIALFPEQVHLLNTAPPRLFLSGPPGTGKTIVLLLKGREWLQRGCDVNIVSSGPWSRAACCMLYNLLLQRQPTEVSAPGQVFLRQYDFTREDEIQKALEEITQSSKGGSLYIIADEGGFKIRSKSNFYVIFDQLFAMVPRVHFWAANCYHKDAPSDTTWQVAYLTRPLRSPPAVVREVEKDKKITEDHDVVPYSERGVPDHTTGPAVTRLYHRGEGHAGDSPDDCAACGREVAAFLHSLHVGDTMTTTSTIVTDTGCFPQPPGLKWKDVLVLSGGNFTDDSGVLMQLRDAGIPVRVMTDDDTEDVAMARSDVVWAASAVRVCGLERKVVVCLELPDSKCREMVSSFRLHLMSRCSSQLVIVFRDN